MSETTIRRGEGVEWWDIYGQWVDAWQKANNADGEFDGLTDLDMVQVYRLEMNCGVEAGLTRARELLEENAAARRRRTAPVMAPLQAAKVDVLQHAGMTVAGQDADGTVGLTGKGDGCTADRFGRVRWATMDAVKTEASGL